VGLFDKIGKLVGGGRRDADAGQPDAAEVQRELAALGKDRRLHLRCELPEERIATLKLSNGLVGDVRDLSYGGLAVRFDLKEQTVNFAANGALPAELKGDLTILDQSIACRLAPVRTFNKGTMLLAGFSMYHDSPETLVFLREMIEPWRWSLTLAPLAASMRHERYKGDEWSCLRGDGPTDVVLKQGRGGQPVEAHLTFRAASGYAELTFKDGQISTSLSIDDHSYDPMSATTRMATTQEADRLVLRQAFYILLNLPERDRELAADVTRAVLAALGVETKARVDGAA
jgi:hypothetical protein